LTCENRCSTDEERDDDDKKAGTPNAFRPDTAASPVPTNAKSMNHAIGKTPKREITGAIEIESSSRIIAPIISGTQPKR